MEFAFVKLEYLQLSRHIVTRVSVANTAEDKCDTKHCLGEIGGGLIVYCSLNIICGLRCELSNSEVAQHIDNKRINNK